jgi:hypothetical protein
LKPGFPIVLDPQGASAQAFQIELGIPFNAVIDRNGKVAGTNPGDIDELKKLVAKVVAGSAPARRASPR